MRNLFGLYLGFAGVLAGCGSTDHDEPKAMAGASAAGTSPTGGVAAAGGALAGGSASGGAAGTASGGASGNSTSGAATVGGASGGPLPTRTDVDLTLGGLNHDLAPTPASCDVAGTLGCISVSGEVGGKKFSATCQDSGGISGEVLGRRQLHCSPTLTGGAFTGFVLFIFLDDYLGKPTSLFSYQSPAGQVPTEDESMALFWLEPDGFRSYELEPAAATHDEVVKVAGLSYQEGKSKFVFGAFAATWTPQASCIDCSLVRLYARFNVVYEL
jgi:hypothetical protein